MLSVRSFECWKVTKTKWLLLFEFCYGLSVGTCIDGRLNSFVIFDIQLALALLRLASLVHS